MDRRGEYGIVVNAVDEAKNLTPTEKLLYRCLLSFLHDRGDFKCWPYQKTLARKIGKSARMVKKLLKRLEEVRLIRICKRGRGNFYEFLDPRQALLERCNDGKVNSSSPLKEK